MKKIRIALLCNVGFEAYWYPLGISMLKENLERCTNIRVDNYYLSSEFSWYIDRYYPELIEINAEIGEEGNSYHEIYFSTKLFNHADPQVLIEKVLLDELNENDIYRTRLGETTNVRKLPSSEKDFLDGVMKYCGLLDSFIAKKLEESNWRKYDLIGFSCISSQFLCSVYMAKRIRQLNYNNMIVFGGGMFRKWNISQYEKLFPFIDTFVIGNGYQAILDMIRKQRSSLKVYSNDLQNHFGNFSDVPKKVLSSDIFIFPVQLSDYCPWDKCMFCSIQSCPKQEISVNRVYEWIINTSNKYGATDFGFADCNLNGNIEEFGKLCSDLAQTNVELDLYGMLNPRDLTKNLCIDLKAAGFSFVLLGFENFSNSMLSRMKKRSTVLDNIKALKWLVEAGIEKIVFNIIIDFPGNSKAIIAENLENIRLIRHLITRNVKCELVEFDLERDAKIYSLRRRMNLNGLTNYEFDEICYPDKMRGALKFHALKYKWFNFVRGWDTIATNLENKRSARLKVVKKNEHYIIYDERSKKARYSLSLDQFVIYKHICDNVSTLDEISKQTRKDKRKVRLTLDYLLSIRVALKEKNKYLGLAIIKDKR
ncbi:MAG: B12-binding domain-containing radical SAM protein [Planctomycetota bacterium]